MTLLSNYLPQQDTTYALPDFSQLTPELVREQFSKTQADVLATWKEIAQNTNTPTVENTLHLLENSDEALNYVLSVMFSLTNSVTTDKWDALEQEISPLLAALNDELYLNEEIYQRVKALDESTLDAETAWLRHRYLIKAEAAGVALDAESQSRLRELNEQIAAAQTSFGHKVVAAMEEASVRLTDEQAATLPEDIRASAAQAAASRNLDGHLITLELPTVQQILRTATDRQVREAIYQASISRGDGHHGESDTRDLVLTLAKLRAQRAELLGFDHHADQVISLNTAGSAANAVELLSSMVPATMNRVEQEAAQLETLLERDHPGATLEPWDWAFYAAEIEAEALAVDEDSLKKYLELDSVLNEGIFYAASQLYGLRFEPRTELAGYTEGVRVYEVFDGEAPLGLFVADFYAREGKRGGAWMNTFTDQSHLRSSLPVVLNNLNVSQPAPDSPTLLTWSEVITAFHEFGHALHALLSNVNYPSLAGTAVPRDFVEFPSQVNEMWAYHPQVLQRFARHVETGEVLPESIIERLVNSRALGQGFATAEYLATALLDLAWHQLAANEVPTSPEQVLEFEQKALKDLGLAHRLISPRYRSTYLNHSFGGGYDAGYYSYMWSEVLDADTVAYFMDEGSVNNDGGLNAEVGGKFRDELLSRGHSRAPMDSYRAFSGREPEVTHLLRRRGLVEN